MMKNVIRLTCIKVEFGGAGAQKNNAQKYESFHHLLIFFSLPVFLYFHFTKLKCQRTNDIGSNRILTNRIRNEWTTIRQMTCLPFLVSTLQLLYPSSYRKHQLTTHGNGWLVFRILFKKLK